jgi:hypothetical protein
MSGIFRPCSGAAIAPYDYHWQTVGRCLKARLQADGLDLTYSGSASSSASQKQPRNDDWRKIAISLIDPDFGRTNGLAHFLCWLQSAAINRRSRCGSVRGCPVLSSHFSPGLAPQVGQRIACIFLRVGFLAFMTVIYRSAKGNSGQACTVNWHGC